MGKISVALRHRSRARLLVEPFEDRRLLSGLRGLFLLHSQSLNPDALVRPLDTQSLTLLSSETTSSPVEPGAEDVIVPELEAQLDEVEENPETEREDGTDSNGAMSPLDTNDESREGPSRGLNSLLEKRKATVEALSEQEANKLRLLLKRTKEALADVERIEQISLTNRTTGNTPAQSETGRISEAPQDFVGDVTIQDPTREARADQPEPDLGTNTEPPPLESPPSFDTPELRPAALVRALVSDPVVVQVLKQYVAEQRDSESSGGGSDRAPAVERTEPEAPAWNSNRSAAGDSKEPAMLKDPTAVSANLLGKGDRGEEAGPKRGPNAQRLLEVYARARAEHDVQDASVSPSSEAEDSSVGPRDLRGRTPERLLQGQALVRQAAEAATAARQPEHDETRQQAAPPAAAEPAGGSGANRLELAGPQSVGRAGDAPPVAATGAALEESAAATQEVSSEEVLVAAGPQVSVMDVAAFVPQVPGLLEGVVSGDPQAVQAAMQQFLAQVESLGGDAAAWLAQVNLSPWVVALAVGLTACDLARRRQKQAQRGLMLTDADGTPLTWFPGLAGLWTVQEA